MKHILLKLNAILLFGLSLSPLQGQTNTMNMKAINGTQTAYALSNIRKLTYPSTGNMTVTKTTGNPDNYVLTELRYTSFSETTSETTSETWTGNAGTDWNTVGNWTSHVPSATTDITIPVTTNQPTVASGTNAACKSLIINSGAQVTIAANGLLNVATDIINNAGTSGIKILSDAILPNGSLIFHNTTTAVPATVEFYSKANITQGPTQYHYQFFGIPFTGMQPLGNLDGSWLFRYNETNVAMWEAVINATPMLPIQGYAITQAAATTYEITGDLYNSDISSYPLTYTVMNDEIGDYKRGEHIIANPYTAAIDINSFTFLNAEETVYLYSTGSYADWLTNRLSAGNSPGEFQSVPKNYAGTGDLPASIPSMQGFIVNAYPIPPDLTIRAYDPNKVLLKKITNGGISSSSSITILYSSVEKNAEPLRVKSNVTEKVLTTVEINGQRFGDKIWLFTEPACTHSFDNGYDGRKKMGSSMVPQFYAVEEDDNYQVNAVDDINNTLLGFTAGVDTEYTMKFTHYNTSNAYPQGIYLLDLVNNDVIDVTENGSTYSFSTVANSSIKAMKAPAATTDAVRFKIVTAPGVVNGVDKTSSMIKVFASGRNIIVDNKTSSKDELMLFDVSGRNLMRKNIDTGLSTIHVDIPAGVYIAQVISKDLTVKSTIIIK